MGRTGRGETVETVRQALVAKIGENIQVRRFTALNTEDGIIGFYRHGDRIGTMVQLTGGNEELAKDLTNYNVHLPIEGSPLNIGSN